MNAQVVAQEFRKIFQVTQEAVGMERGLRSGQVDGRRAWRATQGRPDVFRRRAFQDGTSTVGSLAVCFYSLDLRAFDAQDAQSVSWVSCVRTLEACAMAARIPARFVAANIANGGDVPDDRTAGADVAQGDSLDACRDAARRTMPDFNGWTRHREAIAAAEEWHDSLRHAGQRVTLLVTMWPEARFSAMNRNLETYYRECAKSADHCLAAARRSSLYMLGVGLDMTAAKTWGIIAGRGGKAHAESTFPAARRVWVDTEDDLVPALRQVAQRIATARRPDYAGRRARH